MKKVLSVLVLGLSSCSTDDDSPFIDRVVEQGTYIPYNAESTELYYFIEYSNDSFGFDSVNLEEDGSCYLIRNLDWHPEDNTTNFQVSELTYNTYHFSYDFTEPDSDNPDMVRSLRFEYKIISEDVWISDAWLDGNLVANQTLFPSDVKQEDLTVCE